MDLSAQEVNLSVPELDRSYHRRCAPRNPTYDTLLQHTAMDPIIVAAVAMLAIWAGVTFTTAAPGWIHLLLTAGMFLLIWRIVTRPAKSGTNSGSSPKR